MIINFVGGILPMRYDADAKTIRPNDDNKRNNDNGFTATNFNDAI